MKGDGRSLGQDDQYRQQQHRHDDRAEPPLLADLS